MVFSFFGYSSFPSATNAENKEMNNIKNQLTGEYGSVPDTARHYKVSQPHSQTAPTGLGTGLYSYIENIILPDSPTFSVYSVFGMYIHVNMERYGLRDLVMNYSTLTLIFLLQFPAAHRPVVYPGWSLGMPTMVRGAAGSMLPWNQDTSEEQPSLSRALHASMVGSKRLGLSLFLAL